MIALMFAMVLGTVRAERAPAPAVIGETLWLAREASVMVDATPATAARRLPPLLKQHFNVVLTCGKGQVFDPSAPRCLIGARQIARAFYRGQVRAIDPAVAQVVVVNITDAAYAHVSLTETQVRINLPYQTPAAEAARRINAVLAKRVVRDRVSLMAEYQKALETWNALGLVELDFEDGLTLASRRQTIETLLSLAAEDEGLFERPSEVFYVGSKFRGLFERRLRPQEGLKAGAPIEHVRRFLVEAKADRRTIEQLGTWFEKMRERIRVAGEQLERILKIKYDCSDQGPLTLYGCAHTLERLARFALRAGDLQMDAKMILVVDPAEMEHEFDVVQSVQDDQAFGVFAIAQGFGTGTLRQFARGRGWVR